MGSKGLELADAFAVARLAIWQCLLVLGTGVGARIERSSRDRIAQLAHRKTLARFRIRKSTKQPNARAQAPEALILRPISS